uniref:Uncharacterized protein n=1 Tax=Leersia perrieri TaxID=77586 RepID=A0A0D9XS26_9ORYZ
MLISVELMQGRTTQNFNYTNREGNGQGQERKVSFGVPYQNKRRIRTLRVCCTADEEGEISPLLPSSCRYVPTCSEYSMQAYKRYGVAKGGHGYDPPRWFGEEELPKQ